MPAVVSKNIKMAYHNNKETSSLYVGNSLVWEHPSQLVIKTVSGNNIQVPDWAVAVSIALIGGGGGGQAGDGARGGSGRPGAAANWAVYHKSLSRSAGESFYINFTRGDGGSGGRNADHAAGSNGGTSSAVLWRRSSAGTLYNLGSHTAAGGLGGPSSNLPTGSNSTRPASILGPRLVPVAPHTLPQGTAASRETDGGSPGAGGGYGGGGYFGSRGDGGKGGDGMARFYFYGAP